MHPFDLLLLISALVALAWPLLPSRWRPWRWLRLLPTVNVVLALTHYWLEGLRPSMIPVYVCAGLLWLFMVRQLVRSASPASQGRRRIDSAYTWPGTVCRSLCSDQLMARSQCVRCSSTMPMPGSASQGSQSRDG